MKKIIILLLLVFTICLAASAQEKNEKTEKTSVTLEDKETRPVSMAVVVDNSGSFRSALSYVIDAAKVITNNIEIADEGFLVRFISKDKISILEDLTNNRDLLALAADEMYVEGGMTAIPEALLYSAKHLSENGKNERKIVVLITDGESKSDKKIYADAVSYLKEKKIPVYIVGITIVLEDNVAESKKFLEKLAAETGGSVVFVDRKTSAADAGRAIIKAFREQK